MAYIRSSLVLTLFSMYISIVLASPMAYNVVSLEAKADGKSDSTQAFVSAWTKACASVKPAIIYVPVGRFYLRQLVFSGPCNNNAIIMRIAGTLVAPADYRVLGNTGNWLLFEHVDGVTISGGILDGQGIGLWACKASGNSCPSGATALEFSNSNNIVVHALTSLNSQMFHIVVNGCHNVKMQGIRVIAAGNSPNTDGIHVQLSSSVTILNSKIGTGDDCISIGPGTTNLGIENVACGPGHGIRSSNGFARNILFQHAVMTNVQNPIAIDQNYCPGQVSGVKISDVTYQDIHGHQQQSPGNPCSRVRLENVKLTYKNQVAQASCSHAVGTSAESSGWLALHTAIPTLENLRRKHVIEHVWCVHDSQVKLNVDGAIISDIQTTIIRNDMG
ncbi:polygalacturonase [Quercus suber]|uniref:Polygalacturonase n=1 Tax=Quercus suber TaxID=58331 RepID=A0AAW0J4T5_QUESU